MEEIQDGRAFGKHSGGFPGTFSSLVSKVVDKGNRIRDVRVNALSFSPVKEDLLCWSVCAVPADCLGAVENGLGCVIA